jgi:protein O-GlcNAc transferase
VACSAFFLCAFYEFYEFCMPSKISPQAAALLKQKILQMIKARKYDVALAPAKSLVESLPTDIEAWWLYAQLLIGLSRHEDAVRALYQVCQGPSPYYVQAIELASKVAIDNELWELAIAPAQELRKISQKADEANYLLGMSLDGLRRFTLAMEHFKEVRKGSSHYPYALYRLGTENAYIGDLDASVLHLEKAISEKDDDHLIWKDYLMILNYSNSLSAEYISKKHFQFGHAISAGGSMTMGGFAQFEYRGAINHSRIKLGFVSADLRSHSVAKFLMPIIRQLPLLDWDVTLYADVAKPDAVSLEMQSLGARWLDVSEYSSEQLIEAVRADELDILVDLMGASSVCRLREFAQRMAPIQVTYLGYPNTSGVPAMDYRITDTFADPESEENQKLYSERLVHLPKSFLCFEALNSEKALHGEERATDQEPVLFASFNNLSKYSDRTLDNWSEILKNVPGSRLLLKTKPLMDPEIAKVITQRFAARGIEPDRLELLGWTDTQKDHLALYGRVDVHLDTFPYNGTTTTCEALWQGVPTVSLVGEDHRSRVSYSILSQLEMHECIAHSDQEFVEKAVALSRDFSFLKEFKACARDRMRASPLMDGPGFVKHLDDAFRGMIKEYNCRF